MDYVCVNYGVAEEPWHENLPLRRLADISDYIILTPDNDMYIETLAVPPLAAIRTCGPSSSMPPGHGARAGHSVYRFVGVPSPAILKRVLAEAISLASFTVLSDPGRNPPAADTFKATTPHASPPPDLIPVGMKWICCSAEGCSVLGAEVVRLLATLYSLISGDLALVSHPTEPPFLVKMVKNTDVYKELEAWKGSLKSGMFPIGRRSHWRLKKNIKDYKLSGTIHELLSEVLEFLTTYDDPDASHPPCAEFPCRHLELFEFETGKKTDARKSGDSSEYYQGRSGRSGGDLLSPELKKHIADKTSRDTAILREKRKAADERALTRDKTMGDQ
jgi:hypothetical protein